MKQANNTPNGDQIALSISLEQRRWWRAVNIVFIGYAKLMLQDRYVKGLRVAKESSFSSPFSLRAVPTLLKLA
jgi:hypothetical protein